MVPNREYSNRAGVQGVWSQEGGSPPSQGPLSPFLCLPAASVNICFAVIVSVQICLLHHSGSFGGQGPIQFISVSLSSSTSLGWHRDIVSE